MALPDFLISDQSAEEFFNSLKQSCFNTGTEKLPSFGNESSFLSTTSPAKSLSNIVLAIDVGGTRTKVCVRRTSSGDIQWQEILDLDNKQLKTEGSAKCLSRMSAELSRLIAASCLEKAIPLRFDGVAIVWSNKLQCFPLEGSVKGVGARVFGSKDGQAYRKGEWWNSDIADGDDISAAFIAGLKTAQIQCNIVVIANDTIFTAKALPGSMAGVVASTGANTTIVPVNSSILFNSECGGAIEIPAQFLKLQKTPSYLPGTSIPVKLEDIAAGKGLPRVFQILISEAEAVGETDLKMVSDALNSSPLDARELGFIVGDNPAEGFGDRFSERLPDSTTRKLTEIARQLVRNAGKMCAILILVSVANQLDSDSEILAALDSSQARYVPGYKESLDDFLSAWNSRNKKRVRYQLLSPEGKISVPLRGAANAIEQFL